MSGGDDVTVVWVTPEQGGDDAAHALVEWAHARGLKIRPANDGSSGATLKVDLAIADRVEKELDRAREAIAALDGDAAERALARAEAMLRDHPELPQAAWLRAEVHRSWAARLSRIEPRDDARAQSAWQDADALDGGRAAGIGEAAFPARARTAITLTVLGAVNRKISVRLDGVELSPQPSPTPSADGVLAYPVDTPAAEHQVVVSLDGEAVFASWVSIVAATGASPRPTIALHVGDDGACGASSLARVSRDGNTVRAPGISCDRWVAVVPAERRGAVLVARCERSSCGPFVEWRSEGAFDSGAAPPVATPHGGHWPAWATWTAIGIGAACATTVALIATGVFESRPTEQRFVNGGVRIE